MPRIYIPQTGTRIDWPDAAAGRVRVHAMLSMTENDPTGFKIELSFKRDPFRRLFRRSEFWRNLPILRGMPQTKWPYTKEEFCELLTEEDLETLECGTSSYEFSQRVTLVQTLPPDKLFYRWGDHIAATLYDSTGNLRFLGAIPVQPPRSSGRLQIVEGSFQGLDYRLSLDRDDLKLLRNVTATETGARRLGFEVQLRLLPTALIDRALRRLARGHKNAQIRHDLMYMAQCAVFMAEKLIKQAAQDQALRSRLQKVLLDEECGRTVRKSLQVLTLADRALRPALIRYGINRLIGRRIQDVLDPAARNEFAKMFTASFPEQLTQWFGYLLGPEGQAARAAKLIK